jgi:hypothetical protein
MKSIAESVSHEEFQRELERLRECIRTLGNRSHDLGSDDYKYLIELLKRPEERKS